MSKKRRKSNPFREWLSDNLRYILLFFGIFAVLAGLFFGVRALSGRMNVVTKAGYASGAESEPAAVSGTEAVSGTSSAADSTGGSVSSSAPAAEATEPVHGDLSVSSEQDVTQLIKDYYTAMSVQDLSELQKITDVLPEDQAAKISSSRNKFTDVTVYSKNGPDEDSRIVYAYYRYTGSGSAAPLPGLSQMLVRKGADGQWKIIYSELDEATTAYIDSVTADADVQDLIGQVKAEYEKALTESGSTSEAESVSGTTEEAVPVSAPVKEEADNPDTEEDTAEEDDEDTGDGEEDGSDEEESWDDEDTEEPEDYGETEELGEDEWIGTINSSCNVRSGAGYDFSVTGGVTAGTEVTVIGTEMENGWWHIRTDEIEGYIGGRFID